MMNKDRAMYNLPLSDNQKKVLDLYVRAEGECLAWIKNGKLKLIDPEEVVHVVGNYKTNV